MTGLLILAINQVFSSVSKAVRIGIGASEIIQNSRIIGDQLQRDFSAMIGPGENGFLVIVNKKKTGIHILRQDKDTGFTRTVRSDQIMFITRRVSGSTVDQQEPIDPGDNNHYQARSEERRVGKECRSRWSP